MQNLIEELSRKNASAQCSSYNDVIIDNQLCPRNYWANFIILSLIKSLQKITKFENSSLLGVIYVKPMG